MSSPIHSSSALGSSQAAHPEKHGPQRPHKVQDMGNPAYPPTTLGGGQADSTEIQRIIRDYYEQLYEQ